MGFFNSVFNVNRRNNQILYASFVIGDGDVLPIAKPFISNNDNNTDSNITSVLNYNSKESHCYIQLLHQ